MKFNFGSSHQSLPGSNNGNGNGHGNNGNGSAASQYLPIAPLPQVVDDSDDFDLSYLLVALKRRAATFIGVTALAAAGLVAWQLTRPPAYQGSFELLVEPVTVVNDLELGDMPLLNEEQSGLDYTSQIRVLRSPAVLGPIVEAVQERYPQITYESLLGKLTISRQADSKVLSVAVSGSDPEMIQFIMTQLAAGFINYSVQDRQADLRRGLEFVDEQLQEKWQEVETIETELSDIQKQHDLVNIESVNQSVTERMNTMMAQQESIQVELSSLQTLYGNLQAQVGFSPGEAIRIANLSESPQYQTLLAELRQLEQEIASESARFRADTPMIQALEDRRQQLLPLLQAEAQRTLGSVAVDPQSLGYQGQVSQGLMQELVSTANRIQVLQTQSQAIDQVTNTLQAEIQYLADLARLFQQVERELTVAESNLNQLLASRQELRFQMAQQNSPWELMTPLNAASVDPLTQLPRKLLLSGIISVLLGASAALLQDKLDRVFHNVDEILEATKLPALATIPYVREVKQQGVLMSAALVATIDDLVSQPTALTHSPSAASFAFSESFFSLHTNLKLLSSDTPMQVVTITSARPGEGKSTICAHLAMAATSMGQRVLLIDGDMRKPSLHSLFQLPNRVGLSNLITADQDLRPQAIQPVSNTPNLSLISAGLQPPAPGGLLSSKRMQQLVTEFRQVYDLVIIDTPPLLGIADAKLAATHADGLLLVTKLDKTPRSELQRVLSDLSNTMQAPLLGLVVNGAHTSKKQGYYHDYYNHYSHQGNVEKKLL